MGTPRVRWRTPAAGALLERKEDQGMKTRSFNLSQDQIDDLYHRYSRMMFSDLIREVNEEEQR